MDYIPKRVLFEQFPVTGVYGITALEAFDLALDGELAAYYHIPIGFDLQGASGCSYGDYHWPLAQLPIGKLGYLQAHGAMTFSSAQPLQAEKFQSARFGPAVEHSAIRLQFELEEYFWLFLKTDEALKVAIGHVIFMRDDLKKIADSRQAKPPEPETNKPKPSHLLAIAALLELLQAPIDHPRPQGMNQSAIKSAILDRLNWRGLSQRTLDAIFADANKAKTDAE